MDRTGRRGSVCTMEATNTLLPKMLAQMEEDAKVPEKTRRPQRLSSQVQEVAHYFKLAELLQPKT